LLNTTLTLKSGLLIRHIKRRKCVPPVLWRWIDSILESEVMKELFMGKTWWHLSLRDSWAGHYTIYNQSITYNTRYYECVVVPSNTTIEDPGKNRLSTSPCEWGGPSDETRKTEVPCHSRCGAIKIPPCSKARSAEHRPKFYSLSPVMLMSPYLTA
jgi:hypothetical protein